MPSNTSDLSSLTLLPYQFITKIVHDADTGWGFVPLIGSGLSRPSGIITGYEFTNYLAFTTYLVLCDPATRKRTHGEGFAARWNLVKQGWPPQPNQRELTDARNWILQEFEGLCRRLHIEPNYDGTDKRRIKSLTVRTPVSPSQGLVSVLMQPIIPAILASEEQLPTDDRMRRFSMLLMKSHGMPQPASFAIEGLMSDFSRSHGQHIQEMGIRALHDWRETLQFLACTEVLSHPDRLSFNPTANQSIIDAFNSTITRDRHPNLAHKMLAHLAGGLRIHTILTTNFDTLTEDAFQQLSVRLRVLPVSSHGSLPNARTVAAEDTLVKLHGEAHDTRADLSLDDEPRDTDLETFADYLTRGGPYSTVDEKVESRRLLVMGYSGSDYRCVQMIKRWLESAADRPIIYWVCFSQSDVRRVQHIFRSEQYRGRLRITQTTRPDLLLYELYQRLHLSLPPGGLSYEFSHILPPRQHPDYHSADQSVMAVLDCVRETKDIIEAGRLISGHQGRLEDVRALARDAMVQMLSARLVKIMAGGADPTGNVTGHWRIIGADREPVCVTWQPWYRCTMSDIGKSAAELRAMQFVAPVIIEAVGGVVRACAIATEKVSREQGLRVFWMETVDYIDVDGMIRDFFRSLAHRFGVFQSQHVSLHPLPMRLLDFVKSKRSKTRSRKPRSDASTVDWDRGVQALADHLRATLQAYRVDANQLRIIIYGRDGYGCSAGLLPTSWSNESLISALHCFIESLGRVGVQVVYFPLLSVRAKIRTERKAVPRLPLPSRKEGSIKEAKLLYDNVVETARSNALHALGPDQDESELQEICRGSSVYADHLRSILHPFVMIKSGDVLNETAQAGSIEGQENAEKFFFFLYSLCLFRHSRHPNALCSEATYQCPYRHNPMAIDNDFVRSEVTSQWVARLTNAGLFLSKPGGATWMYGDLKSGILNRIESLDSIAFLYAHKSPLNHEDNPIRCHSKAIEMRARLHFWIGDWYLKAFCSSGHHVPILEAVHHQLMACCYAWCAEPKKAVRNGTDSAADENDYLDGINVYRHQLFLSALREASKTLRIAVTPLKLWQSSPFDVSWMDAEQVEIISEQLSTASEALFSTDTDKLIKEGELRRDMRGKAVQEFADSLRAVCEELTLEGGGKTNIFSGRSNGIGAAEDRTASFESGIGFGGTQDKDSVDNSKIAPEELVRPILGEPGVELYSAVLAIAKRPSKTETDQGQTSNAAKHSPVTMLSRAKANWKRKYAAEAGNVVATIRNLFDAARLVLRRAKLEFHATNVVSRHLWLESTILCNLGVDLCKHLPASELRFDMDMRVRLHSVYSVGLANLGRFFEANRHLNEAQALLSKLEWSQPSDSAIIAIRRAEVRLTECLWIAAFLPDSRVPMLAGSFPNDSDGRAIDDDPYKNAVSLLKDGRIRSKFLRNLLKHGDFVVNLDGDQGHHGISEDAYRAPSGSHSHSERWTKVFVPPRISECLRKGGVSPSAEGPLPPQSVQNLLRLYGATLDEAVSLLEQGEKLLRGNSQSALWWNRLYTLRLRVYGILDPLQGLAETSLIRRKYSFEQGIHENFLNALRIAGADKFRKLRAIRYFFEANAWYKDFVKEQAGTSEAQELLPTALEAAHTACDRLDQELEETVDTENSLLWKGLQLVQKLRLASH